MTTPEWLVVLRADGVVESVEGAPDSWLNHKLASYAEAPAAVRRAATALMRASTPYLRRRRVKTDAASVELVLVEALPIRRSATRPHDLVMRTLDIFMSQAKSGAIDLTVEQEEGVPSALSIDGEKVAWALATLIANALRYARQHVRIHVRLDDETKELLINVSDDGPGIPEQKLRWLFERDPESGQSTGLALPMVRDVMVAHRGTVSVQSLAGQGTRFTLRLPTST
jgi:signal transduction histidine kinase